ncbi:MAG: hypothetical protein AAF400_01945 [Bacteroidota bacterium]
MNYTNNKLSTMKRTTLILMSALAVSLGSLHAASLPSSGGVKGSVFNAPTSPEIPTNRAIGVFAEHTFSDNVLNAGGSWVAGLDLLYYNSADTAKGLSDTDHAGTLRLAGGYDFFANKKGRSFLAPAICITGNATYTYPQSLYWGFGGCLRWRLPKQVLFEIEYGRQFNLGRNFIKLATSWDVLSLLS